MAITRMTSYDLKGKKLSFADWVSNISPTDTPFCSMTGKEAISQTKFSWQTDMIPPVNKDNAVAEGSKPKEEMPFATVVKENNTQIFRREVSVSDTANVVQYYGRGQEVGYQMEKAALELKRDLEKAFLWQRTGRPHSSTEEGHTAGFVGMVSTTDATDVTAAAKGWNTLKAIGAMGADVQKSVYKDPDTGAIIAFVAEGRSGAGAAHIVEQDLYDMTYNLYLANSKANVIMYHPKHAAFFSSLIPGDQSVVENRLKMFGTMDSTYNVEVDTIIDPLGQKFALVPNRLMPEGFIYFFNPSDWTQMILRAPKKIQLAKQGSSQEWMIECELGLRHRNPYASGVLKVGA